MSTNLYTLNPKPFLGDLIGQPIAVKLKWHGTEYRGLLKSFDSYMNLQLVRTREFLDGQEKGALGDVLIRCNNVLYVRDMRFEQPIAGELQQ